MLRNQGFLVALFCLSPADANDLLSVDSTVTNPVETLDIATDVNAIGVLPFGDDTSGDLDLSVLDLDAHHVVTRRPDSAANLDASHLAAEGDCLERDLHAFDEALTLATVGRQVTGDLQDREGLAYLHAKKVKVERAFEKQLAWYNELAETIQLVTNRYKGFRLFLSDPNMHGRVPEVLQDLAKHAFDSKSWLCTQISTRHARRSIV